MKFKLTNSRLLQAVCLSLVVFLASGCQTEVANDGDSSESNSKNESASDRTTVVSPASATNVESPAQKVANKAPGQNPDLVCQQFLDALQGENAIVAGQQLTKKALFETRRADLELGAPGGENATYKLGKTFYATDKKEVAQVECFVSESGQTSLLLWILKNENVGWKISGMYMQSEDANSPGFIDFENRTVVEGIKMAVQDFSDENDPRQAKLPSEENLK